MANFLKRGLILTIFTFLALGYVQAIQAQRCSYLNPDWSPDGRYLAYISFCAREDMLLHIVDDTGEHLIVSPDDFEQLTSIAGAGGVAWLNESQLFFLGRTYDRKRNPDIQYFQYDIETGELTLIPGLLARDFSYQPNSDLIYYTEPQVIPRIFSYQRDIFTIDFEGNITQITATDTLNESVPVWSRDGEYMAYTTEDALGPIFPESMQLVIMDANYDITHTTEFQTIITVGPHDCNWSPDNLWLLCSGTYRNPDLYLINVFSDDEPIPLGIGDAVVEMDWSPDGTKIAYTTQGVPGRNELKVIDTSLLGINAICNCIPQAQQGDN